MENKEFQFKTNLNCGGCVSKVAAVLDHVDGIRKWNVDIDNPDKILTVTSEGITTDQVVALIESKGFTAEPLAQ
ncbi:heavy-metal-associated domain-containing protein [Sphingobacterium sp. SGG-5]|uniref:heavy-metal-associated domain-containing protein n=1 Tax=Sphingobacterium sp. SGG-5 TaxID=2710881 RepID=UPI0013EC564E|nr:heavy-metal-associated domain-containing protein [Sphingobacterium sp. SGG-5]NGM62741.1 heavy-metal-associated domain-containing protein [Sphingobacterium sp. SGG-5]